MSWQGLCELASQVQNGETTSTILVQNALSRIKTVDADINSVVLLVDQDTVLQRAAAIDALSREEKLRLPLAGVPITIKEHIHVAGLPTTAGDSALASPDRPVPRRSAEVVRALEEAGGAIVIGQTNLPLHCADYQSYNDVYGRTNNPHDLSTSPGGSSGGSAAAVAAGLVPLCLGTDIGGSVRVPAHCCGVFAHKPTWGVISQDYSGGSRAPKAMSTTGPIARRAQDLTLVTRLLFAHAREPFGGLAHATIDVVPETTVTSLRDLKVAVWEDDAVCPVDEAVASAVRATVELLRTNGAVVTYAKPHVDSARLLDCYRGLAEDAMEGTNGTRSHAVHLEQCQIQCEIRAAFDDFLRAFDVLLTPTFPVVAFPHEGVDDEAHHPFYRPSNRTLRSSNNGSSQYQAIPYHLGCFWPAVANLTLLPATAVPVQGETPGQLPVALQLVGRELADGTCLKIAELLEEAGRETGRVAQFRIPVRLQE